MFGVVPKNLWSRSYSSGDSQNRIPMAARVMLIQGEGRNILIDTGNGDKLSEKLQQIYGVDNSEYTLAASLARYGLKQSDIT
ncbi:MAG: MBL fold metallo-hydrolase, partial [Candidatus Kapabacteria bacterium]|nr:MBL fold metallo-hydrolase [Candidatus Kapabacteria bacterium]